MGRDLMKQSREIKEGESLPLPRESKPASSRGTSSCPNIESLFSFLKLTAIRIPPEYFGAITSEESK